MDVGSVYGSYYETAKSYMGLRKEEKQAGFTLLHLLLLDTRKVKMISIC